MAIRMTKGSGELQRPQKSHEPKTSTTLTLATSYADVDFASGDPALELGGAPWITFRGEWTVGSSTTITLKVWVSQDGTNWCEVPILSAQSGVSGGSNAYPHEVTYAAADWSGSSTIQIPLEVRTNGWRYAKVQAKVDSITGAPTLDLFAAAGNEN